MSSKNYNKPMAEGEFAQRLKVGVILSVSSIVFMGLMTALVYTEVLRLHPSSVSADTLQIYAERVKFVFQYQTLLAAWLLFNIFATIYVRITTMAINPLYEEAERNVLKIKCILTNSYEQIVLSLLAQLIFVGFAMPESVLKVIPLVNIIQFIGRIAFFYGYPFKRAFGFWASALPTVLLVLYDLYSFGVYLMH